MNDNKIRQLLVEAKIGCITQGTIFTGAKSRLYPNSNVMGLVITPRCDIAQQKVEMYYYLPVVTFADWIKNEMPSLFLSRLSADNYANLKKELNSNGISNSIMDRFSINVIKEILNKKHVNNKYLNQLLVQAEDLERCRNNLISVSELVEKHNGVKKNILNELVANKNINYYILEESKDCLYIIRMKEVNRIQPEMFYRLRNGIDYKLTENELFENDLCQVKDNLLMPIYEVKSPYIEHIIQHFLQSFNRIGVEDMSKAVVDQVVNIKM